METVGRNDQFPILPRAIDRLMQLDPGRAVAWMRDNAATYREGSTTFLKAFGMAAQRDFDAARKLFDDLPAGDRRNQFGKELLAQLAGRSPSAAKTLLASFPAGAPRRVPCRIRPAAMARDPGCDSARDQDLCADQQGFSLHAAVRCDADERQRLD